MIKVTVLFLEGCVTERRFSFAGGSLPLGKKVYLCGILNITPDSFYDGGRYFAPADALKKAESLLAEGADILDVGALSTRPGAARADAEEELRRLRSVLPTLRRETGVPISVDTYRPAVARYCLSEGADIINDVSGALTPEMAAAVKVYGAGWVVMHAGPPGAKTEDQIDYPEGAPADVARFFTAAVREAETLGIPWENLCLDPGFGFAKTNAQNEDLLAALPALPTYGCAMLAGLSRKRFVRALAAEETDEAVLDSTLALDLYAALGGADILRVHDVLAHRRLLGPLGEIIKRDRK